MQCSYFVYTNDFVANVPDSNMSIVLSYKLSSSRNFIKAKLKSTIEVPYYDEDETPAIDFLVTIKLDDIEKNVKATMIFADCQLSFEEPRGIYKLEMVEVRDIKSSQQNQNDENDIKFILIVEVKALASEQQSDIQDDSSIRQRLSEQIQVFGLDVINMSGYNKFIRQRQIILEQSNLLKATKCFTRHRLDIKLFKQSYQIYLDDDDPTTVYYFFLEEKDKSAILAINLIELIFNDYSYDDNTKKKMEQIKMTSSTSIGSNQSIKLQDFYIGENQKQSAFVVEYEMFQNFKVTLKLTFLKQNDYTDKFLGYGAIKVLETRLFDSDMRPTYLQFKMISLDSTAISQKWVLKPFDHVVKQNYVLNTWDFQHSVLINKLNKNQNDDQQGESRTVDEQLFEGSQNNKIDITLQDNEFTETIKYYDHVAEYEKILKSDENDETDLSFTQRENHIFFKTSSPMDYFEIILEGDPVKDKQGFDQPNIIGTLSSSLFKVKQNQLIIGFIIKSKGNKVQIKNCLAQFDDIKDDKQNLEELLDNESDELIGTIKYYVEYQGFNSALLKKNAWINKLSNLNFNSQNFMNLIKSNITNKLCDHQKKFIISIRLAEIWNLFDMFLTLGYDKELELAVKLGQVSYSIPLVVTFVNREALQNDKIKQDIAYQLETERKKCVIEIVDDKKLFYFIKDDQEYAVVTIDQDISGDMIFQVQSNMDSMIVSLRQLHTDQIYCFTSVPLREVCIIYEKGSFILPVKLSTPLPLRSRQTSVFFCKFNYKILNYKDDELTSDTGLYHFGVYIPQQGFPTQVAQIAKQELYEISVESFEGQEKRHSKQIIFNQSLIRFNTESIPEAEYWRKGQLLVRVVVKKIYSAFDDSFINLNENRLKEQIILINPDLQDTPMKAQQIINLKPNYYQHFEMQFKDDKLWSSNLKLILYIGFRSSQFLQNPVGEMKLNIPPSLETKMIESDIFMQGSELRFKLQSSNIQRKKVPQKLNEQSWVVGQTKQRLTFQTQTTNDNLVFQAFTNGESSDSDLTRLSELIMIPWQEYRDLVGFNKEKKEEVVEQSDDEEKPISVGSVLSVVEENTDDILYWTFISYNGKRLEFLVSFLPKVKDNGQEEQLKDLKENLKQQQIEIRNQKQEDKKPRTIAEIKAAIIQYQDDNNQLGTKVQRERKLYEKNCLQFQQLRELDDRAINQTPQKAIPSGAKNTPILNSTYHEPVVNKAKELFKEICQCGAPAPKFNGFCGNCLKQMRDDYEAANKDYLPIAATYEQQYTKNMQLDVKIIKMNNKIANLKLKLTGEISALDPDEQLLKDEMDQLKQQVKVVKVECTLLTDQFNLLVEEKSALQQDIQQRIIRKDEKIKILNDQKSEMVAKTNDIQDKLKENRDKLTNALINV